MKKMIKFILIGDRKFYEMIKSQLIGFSYPILGEFVIWYFNIIDRIYNKFEVMFE